jgi:hypothetical protein
VAGPRWVLAFMSPIATQSLSFARQLATEQHFTPTQLAALWGMSPSKVRDLFAEEEGVIRFGEPSRREGKQLVRSYYSMRIPESVAARVHDSLTSTARRPVKRVPRPYLAPKERSVA